MSVNKENRIETGSFSDERRSVLKLLGVLGLVMATPAYAIDIFKMIDPEGKNKDLQKAKQILDGAGNIASSSTELDYESEFSIGESLGLEGFRRYGLPVNNNKVQRYVNLVGNAVARSSFRPSIPYYFTVVDNSLYNAFACPGGLIFITSTLMKSMKDEAQLASVLAHEISHVSHKHALQSIQRAKFFEGVGKITAATMKDKGKSFQDMIGNLQTVLFDKGLDQNMEFEADASGMEVAYRTGYDPTSFVQVLEMLHGNEKTSEKKGSWFSTHPPLTTRIGKCKSQLTRYKDASQLAKVSGRFEKFRELL